MPIFKTFFILLLLLLLSSCDRAPEKESVQSESESIERIKKNEPISPQPAEERQPVIIKQLPPETGDCKLSRKVYLENGEWKVAFYPGASNNFTRPKRPECLEKEREMERLYFEHIWKKK